MVKFSHFSFMTSHDDVIDQKCFHIRNLWNHNFHLMYHMTMSDHQKGISKFGPSFDPSLWRHRGKDKTLNNHLPYFSLKLPQLSVIFTKQLRHYTCCDVTMYIPLQLVSTVIHMVFRSIPLQITAVVAVVAIVACLILIYDTTYEKEI